MPVRTVLEHGPKDKKVVAFAVDWPGWSRGAKTSEEALATLESYRVRYRPIAVLAGLAKDFDGSGTLRVAEDKVGTGSTDFWGISFSPSSFEQGTMEERELDRKLQLLRACWSYFDVVAARVSSEMRKGPRGGGRDRDQIVRHTVRVESEDFAKRVGLRLPEGTALNPKGLIRHRESFVAAMEAYNAGEGSPMRSWTLPFLIRHSAFHVMDHAWEMEDKDLSGAEPAMPTARRATSRATPRVITSTKRATTKRATTKRATTKRATTKRATTKRATTKRATTKRGTTGKSTTR
jgi:hypothetical protein